MVQLETLEKTIEQQQKELKRFSEQNSQQTEEFSRMKQDLETRLEKVQLNGYECSGCEKQPMHHDRFLIFCASPSTLSCQ
jgi:esterase/lipase